MASAHGGYRAPANPAPVSGPGAHSARTDGGPSQAMSVAPNQDYGAMSQQMNDQRIAPMGGKPQLPPMPNVPASPNNGTQMPPYQGGDFAAPSTRPGEPVTAGVPIGPGPGPAQLPSVGQKPTGAMTQMLTQLSATDATGVIASLLQAAQQRGV
jgi:hypothetical protein